MDLNNLQSTKLKDAIQLIAKLLVKNEEDFLFVLTYSMSAGLYRASNS